MTRKARFASASVEKGGRIGLPLALAALLLSGCTGWPFPGDYAAMPADKEMVRRFDVASKRPLASPAEITKIKRVIQEGYPDCVLNEIRWLSPMETIVLAIGVTPKATQGDRFLIPVHKGTNGWQADQRYLDLSNG